jgi:hypothetical protein
MKDKFIDHKFRTRSADTLKKAIIIIDEMSAAGYTLTLRQLYYQFVSRDWIANAEKEYKRLGDVVRRGREAGLIDWDAIEDRNRTHYGFSRFQTPEQAMADLAQRLKLDPWLDQDFYVEVWVEKQALESVIGRACSEHRARYMACKGYMSTSETYDAGRRFERAKMMGQKPVMIHLGDHDPSGIDMTRDNSKRLDLFSRMGVDVRRLALKLQDSRAGGYVEAFGKSSWELDALPPAVLEALIKKELGTLVNPEKWAETMEREEELKLGLQALVDADFEDLTDFADRIGNHDPKLLRRIDDYDGWVDTNVIDDDPVGFIDGAAPSVLLDIRSDRN